MKIFWLSDSIARFAEGSSGSDVHDACVRGAMAARGHEVVTTGLYSGAGARDALAMKRSSYGLLKRFLPHSSARWMRDLYVLSTYPGCQRRLRRAVRENKPDLIYERFSDFHSGAREAIRAGIPYILEVHATNRERVAQGRRAFSRIYDSIQQHAAKLATLIVVVSSRLKDELTCLGVNPDKVLVVPNGVDPTIFRARGVRDSIRQRLGIEKRDVVVGFVGSGQPFHGMNMLPELYSALQPSQTPFHYLIIGGFRSVPEEAAFRASLRTLGAEAHFTIVERQANRDVPQYLEAMDICLMPDSNEYGSPIKLFEYGAMQKPCVMPNYAPIAEIVEHERTALLFIPKSISSMAEQLLRLSRDPGLSQQLATTFHHIVLTNHTWEANISTIFHALKSVKGSLE